MVHLLALLILERGLSTDVVDAVDHQPKPQADDHEDGYAANRATDVTVKRRALDNAPLGRSKDAQTVSYVGAALDDLAAKRPVRTSETQPYGCGVKY